MSNKIRFLSQKEITGLEVGNDHWAVYCLPHLDERNAWCKLTIKDFLEIFPACAADMVQRSTDGRCSPSSSYFGMLTEDFILVWHGQALIDLFLKRTPIEMEWLLLPYKFAPILGGAK